MFICIEQGADLHGSADVTATHCHHHHHHHLILTQRITVREASIDYTHNV